VEVEHVALAADLLHASIRVHDVALGRQGGRRRRVARRVLGALGMLDGQNLILRSLEVARQVPPTEVVNELLDTMREISEARAMRHEWSDELPGPDVLLAHAEQYSGAMFSFACRAGGRLANANRTDLTSLGRYGLHMGVAFQFADDLHILELPSIEQQEAIADRAQERRPLHPVSLAGQNDPEIARLWKAMGTHDGSTLHLMDRVQRSGSIGITRERVQQSVWSARRALRSLPPSVHRDEMESLALALAS
jgi:geranylgeranyl pyrophosphate synthase